HLYCVNCWQPDRFSACVFERISMRAGIRNVKTASKLMRFFYFPFDPGLAERMTVVPDHNKCTLNVLLPTLEPDLILYHTRPSALLPIIVHASSIQQYRPQTVCRQPKT